jgi:hypothetical protein
MKKTAAKTASSARRVTPKSADNGKAAAPTAKPAPKPVKLSPTAASAALLAKRVDFETFLGKLGAKDRQNIEKHIAALEAEPDNKHLKLWKRLVTSLATLAGHAAQTNGQQSIQFFIADGADGRYRKQVFALEDVRDGKVTIYTGDVVEKALASGILEPGQPGTFGIAPGVPGGSGSERPGLTIDALDSTNTPDPPAFYKHMLGWNRKALRIVLPNDAATVQINAAEELCALAARDWNPQSA